MPLNAPCQNWNPNKGSTFISSNNTVSALMSIPTTKSRHRTIAPAPVTLPNELITEVLSWLNVKSLMQMKCVSKSWNSLISDPSFVKIHLKRSARNMHLALLTLFSSEPRYDEKCSVIPFPISYLLDNPSVTHVDDRCYQLKDKDCCSVVGSCNGLICLLDYSLTIECQETWFCFWNPATRTLSKKLGSFRLSVDDRYGNFKFAFGYDNTTETYKVVALRSDGYNEAQPRTKVTVFNLGDNVWRDIQSFPVVPLQLHNIRPGTNGGVYFNGTLNWLAIRNNGHRSIHDWEAIGVDQFVIISLDLGMETHKQLLPPRGFDEMPLVEPTVCVLMDYLCFSHDFKRTEFIIWQMTEFGVEESWTQLLKIGYHNLQIINYDFGNLEYRSHWFPLHLSDNDASLILTSDLEDQAIVYNWRDNRVKRTKSANKICWFFAKDYVESLVSIF